ncbi:DUF1570 domain-containing protein [Gayadomonas joobiniege]|uniref:DUF1570 domain-containing protein n=1 Tax=Gayadomonas joobiniege TaxID=1234606 RepID=UPI000380311A|nr:DUF1570 domain-containing protein [Gayadomonas joobiniege]
MFKGITITLIIILSIGLTLFFTDRQFFFQQSFFNQIEQSTQSVVEQIQHMFEPPQHSQPVAEDSRQQNNLIQTQHQTLPNPRPHHVLDKFVCQQQGLGEVQYQKVQGLYTWVDERGIRNISDQKPEATNVSKLNLTTTDVLDYFDLTLTAESLPVAFKNTLKVKLNTVFRAYAELLGKQALKKVKLNLHILPDRAAYQAAISRHGGNSNGNIGMYLHASNTALIEYRGETRTMQTAVHEAVHAINHTLIGRSPRWLNEGLAEYFERTQVIHQQRIIHANPSWVKQNKLNHAVLSPEQLLQTPDNWPLSSQAQFYASSWALIYFLMDSQRGKQALANYIKQEQQQPCERFNANKGIHFLTNAYPNLRQQFNKRMQQPMTAHKF